MIPTATMALAVEALGLASKHSISAYDAAYVALAIRMNVPLITADQRLANRFTAGNPTVTWLGNWSPPR